MAGNGVLARLLGDLDKLTKRIDYKNKISNKQFELDWETQYVVERLIQNAVQCSLDIGARLIATRKLRTAQNYKDIFHSLREGGCLPSSLSEQMAELVQLRNEIAHEYREILPSDVLAAFRKINTPLKAFLKTTKRVHS